MKNLNICCLLLVLLITAGCNKDNGEIINNSSLFKVKYEVDLSSFDDCRLQIKASVIRNGDAQNLEKILENKFTYEFEAPKDFLLNLTGLVINKDNNVPKVDGNIDVNIKIYINGKLRVNSTQTYLNTEVDTPGGI